MKTTEKLHYAKDHYKGKVYKVGSEIGKGVPDHMVVVLESFDYLVLYQVQKAFLQGGFSELAIGKIMKHGEALGETLEISEELTPVLIDFETSDFAPPRRIGSDEETREKFRSMIDAMKLKYFESDVIESRKSKETVSKERSAQVRLSNITFIRERQVQIHLELTEKCSGIPVRKLVSNKQVISLINENNTLEMLKRYSTK